MYSVFQTYFTVTWLSGAHVAASGIVWFYVVQAPIPIIVKVYTIEHQTNNALAPPEKQWLGRLHLDL